MSSAYQDLTEDEIQRELEAAKAYYYESDEDDAGNSWIHDLDNTGAADRSGSNVQHQLDVSGGGIDLNTIQNWIFPIHSYEKREYQLEISRSALVKNTLVILPTGLGKTFVASVVIYNFMRYFPNAKVIFMAPTRPLVAQQMSACYDVVGISKDDTVEITGRIKKDKRVELWERKKLFFCTPQTLQFDIDEQTFPAQRVKLIVFDEAHKAKGNYAYCQVIKAMLNANKFFRVLALTATAGKSADIIDIIKNLLIEKIEYREETSIDVFKYTHKKKIECVEVKFTSELKQVIEKFNEFIDPLLTELRRAEIIKSFNISRGYLIMMQENLRKNTSMQQGMKSQLMSLISTTISLYSSYEILQRFGIHLFLKSFKDNEGKLKFTANKDFALRKFLNELGSRYGNLFDDIRTSNQITDYGHPKFELLKVKLEEYFDNDGAKVIIFSEYRDSVELIQSMLNSQMKGKVKSKILIGQGGKMTQKEQLAIMKDFREGKVNTLVCTCVAEEGLDIGEVDLVICFDIANKNLTRFVQRIGRTGRKRTGQVIVLASEGRELHNSRDLIHSKDTNNRSIKRNKEIPKHFYNGPLLFPQNFNPKCLELRFKIDHEEKAEEAPKGKGKKTKVAPKKKPSTTSIKNHFKPVNKNEVAMNVQTDVHEISDDEIKPPQINANDVNTVNDFDDLLIDENEIGSIAGFLNIPPKKKFNLDLDEDAIAEANSQERHISRYNDPFNVSDMNRNSSFIPVNTDFIRDNFPDSPARERGNKNFTTPLRKLIHEYDDSPLITDFNPHRKDMFASTPVVTRKIIKSPLKEKTALQFFGLMSIDDIFEGCGTFDEIKMTPESEKFTDSQGNRQLVDRAVSEEFRDIFKAKIEVNQETSEDEVIGATDDEIEPPSPAPVIKESEIAVDAAKDFFAIENIDDLFASSPQKEEEMPESKELQLSLQKIGDYLASNGEMSQSKDLQSSHQKEEELLACNEDMPESKELQSSPEKDQENLNMSDNTVEYDVEEFMSLTKAEQKSNDEDVEVPADFKSPVSSRRRPNLSKLMSAIQDESFLTQEARKPLQERSLNQIASPKTTKSPSVSYVPWDPPRNPKTQLVIKRVRRKKNHHQGYLATQAAVDDSIASSDEHEDDLDNSIVRDFIHDETIATQNQTNMFAKYVQSIQSPKTRGNFKMPSSLPAVNFSQVFSQMPNNSESDDEESDMDSFVVDNDAISEESEPDELELAERKLREMNKKRKRQLKDGGVKRRKIIRTIDSSSDEDEDMKRMRHELLNLNSQ